MTFVILLVVYTAAALLIHELGHLGAARLCRVRAKELALGLGPALLRVNLGGLTFSLRALPLGSFVRLDGSELSERATGQKLLVHTGGVLSNALVGVLFLSHPFGWLNLLIAAGNLLPLYQHDGWKCGVVLVRALLRRESRPAERVFTFSGGFLSLLILWAIIRLGS